MATGTSSTFRDKPELSGGGVLIDLGCHGIDLAFQITGADSAHVLSQCLVFDGEVDRDVTLRAELTGPAQTVELLVELSWLRDRGGEFVVEFEHATARAGVKPGDRLELSFDKSIPKPAPSPQPCIVPSVWAAVARAWSVLLSTREGDPLGPLDPYTSLPTVDLIEQAYSRARLS
jgi:predicted dehydrogenase